MSIILTFSSAVFSSDHAGKTAMNGISYEKYKNFPQDWTLITIRFRKDTSEMRLTYANKIALETLLKGKIDYPDGAVFAKTGIFTGEDSQFPSSVVPRAVRRYQVMVKNKKNYSNTGGWGYALFDANGKTYPEEPTAAQQACFACHAIVENRGYVFSEPFNFTTSAKLIRQPQLGKKSFRFTSLKSQSLKENIRVLIPSRYSIVSSLEDKRLKENVFQGTLDELKPLLENEALASKRPAIFFSTDGSKFVVVLPTKNSECLNELGAEIITSTIDGKNIKLSMCLHN